MHYIAIHQSSKKPEPIDLVFCQRQHNGGQIAHALHITYSTKRSREVEKQREREGSEEEKEKEKVYKRMCKGKGMCMYVCKCA